MIFRSSEYVKVMVKVKVTGSRSRSQKQKSVSVYAVCVGGLLLIERHTVIVMVIIS